MKKVILLLLICLLLSSCGEPTKPKQVGITPHYEAQQPTLSPTEPEDPDEVLAYRRDLVEAEMRRAMSVLWTPAEDMAYSLYSGSMGPEIDMEIVPDRVIHLKAGRIYRGLPYSHGSGSAYSFLSYATAQDENGVYTISDLRGESLTGYPKDGPWSQARIGSDCVDTVFWAWSKVSNSITFTGTGEMTDIYGCVKVGDYTCNIPKYTESTKPICQDNGEEVMHKAYAQLQKGDAIVLYTKASGGHTVMIVNTNVYYNEDGSINPDVSTVTIIENKSESQKTDACYFDSKLGQNVYICGSLDTVWTFKQIYSKGYLPVTCKELIDPSPLDQESVSLSQEPASLDQLLSSTINASHRIANAQITIYSGDLVIQQATLFGRELNCRQLQLSQLLNPIEQAVILGSIDPEGLDKGTYHCVVTCRLGTGNLHTISQFDFNI